MIRFNKSIFLQLKISIMMMVRNQQLNCEKEGCKREIVKLRRLGLCSEP